MAVIPPPSELDGCAPRNGAALPPAMSVLPAALTRHPLTREGGVSDLVTPPVHIKRSNAIPLRRRATVSYLCVPRAVLFSPASAPALQQPSGRAGGAGRDGTGRGGRARFCSLAGSVTSPRWQLNRQADGIARWLDGSAIGHSLSRRRPGGYSILSTCAALELRCRTACEAPVCSAVPVLYGVLAGAGQSPPPLCPA